MKLNLSSKKKVHDNSSIVVSNNLSPKFYKIRSILGKHSKKTLIVVGVAVVLAIGIITIGVFGLHSKDNSNNSVNTTNSAGTNSSITIKGGSTTTSQDQAESLSEAGDYTAAIQTLNNVQKNTTNNEQKSELFQQEAISALDNGQYKDALNFAQEAEAADSSSNTAYLIAVSYQALGQKQDAIIYYQKAIARKVIMTQSDQDDVQYYQNAIKALGG